MTGKGGTAAIKDGALTLGLAGGGACAELAGARTALVAEGAYALMGAPVRCVQMPDGLRIEWEQVGPRQSLALSLCLANGDRPGEMVVTGAVTNRGREPVRLDFIQPLTLRALASGTVRIGTDSRRVKALVMTASAGGYGTRVQELTGKTAQIGRGPADTTAGATSHGVVALHAPADGATLAAGFLNFSTQAGTFIAQHGAVCEGIPQITEFTAELEHLKRLSPGETAELAPLWLAAGKDPHALLERWAELLRERMRITLSPAVPCGWISWYGYRVKLDERIARENARVQRETMLVFGGDLCHLDLGWNAGDRPGDWLDVDASFPSGMRKLCGDLGKEGFHVALWTTPLVVAENSRVAREHSEWLMRDPAGDKVVFDRWYWEPTELCYCLNPALPDVQDHVRRVYTTLRGWGVEAFKLDFSGAFEPGLGNGARPDAARLPVPCGAGDATRMEACRRTYGIIREAIGDAHMTACNVPWQGVVGIADSIFLATDVGNLTDSESQDERPARRGWDLFKERTRQIFTRYFFNGKVWWGNPDCFVAENDAPENHARARLQVVMLAGGQYKCSNQLPAWKPERMAAFLKGLPWYGVAARPVDLFEAEYPSVLDLPVHATWGDWHVVGLFNWRDREDCVSFDLSRLRPQPTGRQFVWEFWDSRFIGVSADRVSLRMPPESACLLCVRPEQAHPFLLATDMHFTMGAMEAPGHEWDEARGTLTLLLKRCPGARGRIWIAMPPGFATAGPGEAEGCKLVVAEEQNGLLAADVLFERSDARVVLPFGKR